MYKAGLLFALLVITSCSSFRSENYIIYKPEEVKVENLAQINSTSNDAAPFLSQDGSLLFFISDRESSTKLLSGDKNSLDIWVSRIDNSGNLSDPVQVDNFYDGSGLKINSEYNEGPCALSPDKTKLYFTSCGRPDGSGDCDLYSAIISNNKVISINNLGNKINSSFFEVQPSISPDGKRLYYVSNRPAKTTKNIDRRNLTLNVWYTDWDESKNDWGKSVRLSDISVGGEEMTPCIASDNVTLFFSSSEYEPNYGGYDIYMTRFDPATKTWSYPENLGRGINTEANEQYPSLSPDGKVIYFTSNRKDVGSKGGMDIYRAVLPISLLKNAISK